MSDAEKLRELEAAGRRGAIRAWKAEKGDGMVKVTKELLQKLSNPGPKAAPLILIADALNESCPVYEINTPARMAMFLAQIAHESGGFRYLTEIWGPTKAQKRYDPPSDLARRLGNTKAGDGERYKGRGLIQLTGRGNYVHFGKVLGLPLEETPAMASEVGVAAKIACEYWRVSSCNIFADKGNFEGVTRLINGGLTGLEDRRARWWIACKELGVEVKSE